MFAEYFPNDYWAEDFWPGDTSGAAGPGSGEVVIMMRYATWAMLTTLLIKEIIENGSI